MLLSAGYEPPRQLFVHGYLNLDDRKISKSLGNVIDPLDLVDVYGVDPVRFWVARVVPFGQDGDVTLDSFRERYERELAQRPRQPALAHDGDDRPLPRRRPRAGAGREQRARRAARALHDDIPAALDRWDVTGALETIWDYVRRLNRHVEQTKPWELAKDPGRAAELDRALYELADGLRIAAVALVAYLPETSVRILESAGPAARRRLGQRRVRPHRSDLRDRAGPAALPADRRARHGGVA